MWKRIVSKLKGTFTAATVSKPRVEPIISARIPIEDREKAAAAESLNDAIRELSTGQHRIIAFSPKSVLSDWKEKSPSALSLANLEELATAYFEGVNIEQNREKSVELWREAMARGSIESKYSYASCLREGLGTIKSVEESYRLMIELAEENNYSAAHYNLGIMLTSGEGLTSGPDLEAAFKHFSKAAHLGVMQALLPLADAYATGKGVARDDYKAAILYSGAAQGGDPIAKFTLGVWCNTGRHATDKEGNIGQPDREKGFSLQLDAANMGHPLAAFNVGCAYLSGEQGVKVNYDKAVEYFQIAVDKKMPAAMVNLGKMYQQGLGVNQDILKARNIYSLGASIDPICKELTEELDMRIKEN